MYVGLEKEWKTSNNTLAVISLDDKITYYSYYLSFSTFLNGSTSMYYFHTRKKKIEACVCPVGSVFT